MVIPAFSGKRVMDKEIPESIKKIGEKSNSFEEVLLLNSKFIQIDGKYIRATRAIDRAYKDRKIFTLKDLRTLHDIGFSLWYRQYYNSFNSFGFEYFSSRLQPGYQELINLWIQKNNQLIQVRDAKLFRQEIFKIWKEFISKLSGISYVEQQVDKQFVKKPIKFKSNANLQFAILSILALIIGIALAILV